MPRKSDSSDHQNLNLRQLARVSVWALKLVFSISPKFATISLATTIFFNLQDLINTYIISRILDKIITLAQVESAHIQDIYPYMIVLVGFNLLSTVMNFLDQYSSRALNIHSDPKLEQALYLKLHHLGIQALEEPEISNKISRARRGLWQVIPYFWQVLELVVSLGGLAVVLVLVLGFAPIIVPIILIVSIPQALADKKYRHLSWKFGYDNTEGRRKAGVSAFNLQSTTSLQEICINGALKFLDKKHMDFMRWYTEISLDLRKKRAFWTRFFDAFGDISVYIGYLIVFSRLIAKTLSIGDTLFSLRVIKRLQSSLINISRTFNNASEVAVRLNDVYKLFQAQPAFEDGIIKLKPLVRGPEIIVEGLTFTYPRAKKPTLRGLDIQIKSGEKVAIVGHNGAGKTTLVKLLCRMYRPEKGKILVNGEALNEFKLDSWHKNMGVLFQDFNMYEQLTVKENIFIGQPNKRIDRKKVVDATNKADALDFINDLPQKFDQVLSERYKGGIRLSTGQWQKIAIARFFYRNAPMVIFDEPTAAIDAISEYNIFNKIYSFFKGKTVIIISHRFSTVRNADRIIVLEKGRIVEEGSHQELMAKKGYYAKSFRLQAEGYTE